MDYFWCIKYQHEYLYIYMKMGKREKRKKRKSDSWLSGPRGFSPDKRAGARASQPRRTTIRERRGRIRGQRHGRGPTYQRGGAERCHRGEQWSACGEEPGAGGPVPGGRGGGIARAGVGVTVVGSIWPVDTRDGRSTARWRAPAAARLPARLTGRDR